MYRVNYSSSHEVATSSHPNTYATRHQHCNTGMHTYTHYMCMHVKRLACVYVHVALSISHFSFFPSQVRELCIKLLPAYPSLSFVTTILHTLTKLSIATLTHVPDQVCMYVRTYVCTHLWQTQVVNEPLKLN